jgi:DNA-binding winged helix-turn-helix (wHTH) protein
LALLLLHANEVASRDRLIDELWRDHAPETATLAKVLQQALPAARRGAARLRVGPSGA